MDSVNNRPSGDTRGGSRPDTLAIGRWTSKLRVACETLHRSQPQIIQAIIMTQLVTDVPWEAGAIPVLCEQLAGEYGLAAAVEQEDRYLTIRLSHPEA